MHKIPYLICLFLFCLVAGMPATGRAGAARISVVMPYIPMMAESPARGTFIRMYEEVAARTGQEIIIDILPPRRAVQSFIVGEYDALGAFPSLSELPVSLASVPYYLRENLIFYKPGQFGQNAITSPDGLAELRVGLSAYHYPPAIINRQDVDFERVPSDHSLLSMIANNRLDAAIIERSSGFHIRDQLGLAGGIDTLDIPLTTENVFSLFQANREGIENRAIFNRAVYDMLCDGTLAGIFGRSDVLPDISLLERDLPPESWRNDCLPSLPGSTR